MRMRSTVEKEEEEEEEKEEEEEEEEDEDEDEEDRGVVNSEEAEDTVGMADRTEGRVLTTTKSGSRVTEQGG